MDRRKHWENIFKEKDLTKVSWSQGDNTLSIKLIKKYAKIDARIIDVGCGVSNFSYNLFKLGYKNLAVLDIAQNALDKIKKQLSDNINYYQGDVLNFSKHNIIDLWHDRAVLHFLTDEVEIKKYFLVLSRALKQGGIAIIATFAPDKTRKCSNLITTAYDKNLIKKFSKNLTLVDFLTENHITPSGDKQLFNYFVLKNSG